MRQWFYIGWVVLLVACLSACDVFFEQAPEGGSAGGGFCSQIPADPQAVGGWMDITLPAGITAFEMRCSGLMDHLSIDMRFDIPPANLADLQAGIPQIAEWQENPELTADDIPNALQNLLQRYRVNVQDMGSTLYGEGNFRNYAMLIDTSNPQRYIVYLATFTSF